jgi:hypothetical protein
MIPWSAYFRSSSALFANARKHPKAVRLRHEGTVRRKTDLVREERDRKRRRQINKAIPQGLKHAVFITEDDKKRTASVSALPGKGRIKLNEWQTAVLADSLSKIVQKWSREKIVGAIVQCIAKGINEDLSEVQTGGQNGRV